MHSELEQQWGSTLDKQATVFDLNTAFQSLRAIHTHFREAERTRLQTAFQKILNKANQELAKAGYKLEFQTDPMLNYVAFGSRGIEAQIYLKDNEPNTTDDPNDLQQIFYKLFGTHWWFQRSNKPHMFVVNVTD